MTYTLGSYAALCHPSVCHSDARWLSRDIVKSHYNEYKYTHCPVLRYDGLGLTPIIDCFGDNLIKVENAELPFSTFIVCLKSGETIPFHSNRGKYKVSFGHLLLCAL